MYCLTELYKRFCHKYIYLDGYRKLNTPKAEIGFGLMMFALRISTSWSLEDLNVCFHKQCGNKDSDSDSAQFCQRLSY